MSKQRLSFAIMYLCRPIFVSPINRREEPTYNLALLPLIITNATKYNFFVEFNFKINQLKGKISIILIKQIESIVTKICSTGIATFRRTTLQAREMFIDSIDILFLQRLFTMIPLCSNKKIMDRAVDLLKSEKKLTILFNYLILALIEVIRLTRSRP